MTLCVARERPLATDKQVRRDELGNRRAFRRGEKDIGDGKQTRRRNQIDCLRTRLKIEEQGRTKAGFPC